MELDASILSDSDKLATFINADQHIRIISRWNYYGKTNNHAEFGKLTKNLYEISNHLHTFPKDKSLPFFKDLLEQSNLKLIYRCLSHQKNQLTINIIKLLNNLINNGYLTLFINNFNLEFPLFKLVLKSDNIRKEFIKFYVNLLSSMSYVDRKFQLTSNTKVWLNIFKLLSGDDEDILDLVMTFIDDKILGESNYSKVTKMTFLNEGTLFNLQKIEKKDTFPLFEKIVDESTGILFKEPPNTTISVNNANFKINNKILYKLLTFLKIDSMDKINLSVLILSKDHNLIEPFMNYLTLNNGNDLVSSIAYNLLFVKVLNLQTTKVSEIYLKPFNKPSLVKNLNHENDYIKHLVMSVIYLICEKFEVLKPFEINKILANLPTINDILSITTSNQVMSLMKVKLLEKLSKYELNNALIKYLNNELGGLVDLKGINLQLFNYYIRIFINLSTNFEIKNVNHLPKMIKFSNLNDYQHNWILYNLINRLFSLPRDNLINPFFSLIFIPFPEELNNLLVELFQRLNSPYKYYDLPFKLHIVIKILVEQYSIFRKKSDAHDSWFNEIINNFFVIGEEWDELERYCKTFDLPITKQPLDKSIKVDGKFIGDDYQLMYNLRKFQKTKKVDIYTKILSFINTEHVNNVNVFKMLVQGDVSLLSEKMKGLKTTNPEVVDFVFQLMQQGDLYELNWLLSEEQLNDKYNEEIMIYNFRLLLSQGKVPKISVEELFDFKSNERVEIIREKLNKDNLIQYIERVCEEGLYDLLSMELSDEVIEHLITIPQPQLSILASHIRSSNPKLEELFTKVTIVKCPNYLNLINNIIKFTGSVDPKIIEEIHNSNDDLSVDLIRFLQKYPNTGVINKIFISITKFFAEDLIPTNFPAILNELTKLFPISIDLNVLNTQLEVFLNSKYVDNYEYLNYINKIIMCYKVDYYKLLMIFLNNKDMSLKFNNNQPSVRIETGLMICNLFFAETVSSERANNVLTLLLGVYCGSMRFEDLMLKEVLKAIETTNNVNWINAVQINNWEINDFNTKDFELIGDQKLIDNGMISINKRFIKNLQHFKYTGLAKSFHSVRTSNLKTNYQSMVNFININVYKLNYNYSLTVYDYEFLMLLIINNEEFFSFDNDKTTVNITNLIDYNILEILIQNYNEPLSKIVIKSLVTNFPEEFKDGNVFKIYLCNLINTYRSHSLSPIQLRLYGSFVPILANPGNFLYETTYKYVLGHPIIKEVELPNFNDIKFENLKMADWYLDLFVNFIDVDDMKVLNKNNFFEWILNLLNMSLLSSTRRKIERIVFHLLEIIDGSNTLVTKYGFLTFLDQVKMNPQIAVKLEMTKTKRLVDWSDGDFDRQLKRVRRE